MLKILLSMFVLLWFARSQNRKYYEAQWDRYDNWEQWNKFDDCKYQEGRWIKSHIFDAYEEISNLRLYSLRNNNSLTQKDSLNVIKVDELENNIFVSGGKDNWFKTVWDRDIFIDYESTYNVKITRSWIINEVITIICITQWKYFII